MSSIQRNAQRKTIQADGYNQMAKLALIGDSSVGKTNILLRYIHSEINLSHIATIGIDFKVKVVDIDGFKLKLQIWDTAGQQRFRNLTGTVYQGAEAILLVYSVTDRKTFTNLTRWIEDVNNNAPSNVVIALAGNKSDLQAERVVSYEEGQKIAQTFGNCIFFETSAKNNINITEMFEAICKKIKEKLIKKSKQSVIKHPPKDSHISPSKGAQKLSQKPTQKPSQKPIKLKSGNQGQKQKKKGCC